MTTVRNSLGKTFYCKLNQFFNTLQINFPGQNLKAGVVGTVIIITIVGTVIAITAVAFKVLGILLQMVMSLLFSLQQELL